MTLSAVSEQRLARALRTQDLATFARACFSILAPGEYLDWNWHLDAICYHLELVRRGKCKRLIIEVPPRSLKSFLTSIIFPAFLLGNDSTSKIITASYSLDLAIKHANDFRALMRSPTYRALFPWVEGVGTKSTETYFETRQRGFRYSTSTGGTLTGRGGDIMIIDDPLKPEDAMSEAKREGANTWFQQTLYSRLNSKKDGAIILVMQRLHPGDMSGFVRETGVWTTLSLPAIAPMDTIVPVGPGRVYRRKAGEVLHRDREPREVLDEIKAMIGSFAFSAQYQQEPVPAEGQIVRWDWFLFFDRLPPGERRIVQSWDVATKAGETNDYSVCTTWAIIEKSYYLLDLWRGRLTFPDLRRRLIELSRQFRAETIVIEDKGTGSALIQQLRSERLPGVPAPIGFVPKEDKVTRMSSETAIIEARQVSLQASASWLDPLRLELAQFPGGRHDDQVDSISQFLLWARKHSGPTMWTVKCRF